MNRLWVVLLCSTVLACGNKKPSSPARGDAGPPPAVIDATPAAIEIKPDSPEHLWAAYQAAHASATKANAIDTGRRIDALLSDAARAMMVEATAKVAATLPDTLSITPVEIRYRMLGEIAAVQAPIIAAATLTVEPTGDTFTLHAKSSDRTRDYPVERAGAEWRFGSSPDLVADTTAVFTLPAGQLDNKGAPTPADAAAGWVTALNGGTGWDAYNLIAPSSRAKLLRMVEAAGGQGDDDVVRILDKTIRDRRDRGVTASAPTITGTTATFHYSDGGSDTLPLVEENAPWWIEVQL